MDYEELQLEIPGLRVAARAFGPADGRPCLAVHGWMDNSASFERLAPLLGPVRLVALELPGHGHSEHRPPAVPYHFIDYAADLLLSADSLGWERFTLIGHSLGAGVAIVAAGAEPERIEALVLIEGGGPMSNRPEEAPKVLQTALQSQRRLTQRTAKIYPSLDSAVDARMASASPLARASAEALVRRGTRAVEGGLEFLFDPRLRESSRMRLSEEQIEAYLGRISAPTLVLMAEDGWPFERSMMQRRLDRVRQHTLVTLPGGHHLHLDHPAPVAAHIRPFLDRERS